MSVGIAWLSAREKSKRGVIVEFAGKFCSGDSISSFAATTIGSEILFTVFFAGVFGHRHFPAGDSRFGYFYHFGVYVDVPLLLESCQETGKR
nr:hypothetical protein Iba_chr05cCG16920 [Ipomoea batatas]GMC98480.1 hypothetical protein Iba_chr05dCG16930 [Ipomoea batatas]